MNSSFIFAQLIDSNRFQELPLILGLFLIGCALFVLIYWIFFTGSNDEGGTGTISVEPDTKSSATDDDGYDFESFPEIDAVSRDRAVEVFAEEINSGNARYDDKYSVVFNIRPEEVDDLQAIKGVGKVFESRLHEVGCFTFKQMANWTVETCREVSQELKSYDRLFRENWLDQARNLHREKYGEHL